MLLLQDENIDNFLNVLEDYKRALSNKEEAIDKLYNEIKIVKKLKI